MLSLPEIRVADPTHHEALTMFQPEAGPAESSVDGEECWRRRPLSGQPPWRVFVHESRLPSCNPIATSAA
jgi:hypothetical protein